MHLLTLTHTSNRVHGWLMREASHIGHRHVLVDPVSIGSISVQQMSTDH